MTATAKQATYRERQGENEGKRQYSLWIDEGLMERIKAGFSGRTASEKVEKALRAALTADQAESSAEHSTHKLDLFAANVRKAAANAPVTGKFRDNKVFIHAAWRAYYDGYDALPLRMFKERLLKANKIGVLKLSRADLAETMDQAMVSQSETSDGMAKYHFVE